MTIKEIHDYIVFILNKETTGYISHKDIDAVIDRGQMSKFMELYGNPKQHQPGRPIPPIAYGQTQKISDDLRYFKKREQFTTTSTGIIDFSTLTEYLHLLGVYVTGTINNTPEHTFTISGDGVRTFVSSTTNENYSKPVKIVNEDQLADRLISQVAAPNVTSPIGILGNGGNKIQLFPEVELSGYIMYLCRPPKPLFSHVIDGRKVIHNPSSSSATFTATNALTLPDGTSVAAGATYTLAGSVELSWPEDCINDIINKALVSLGVHIEDANVYQYTETKNQTGL